MRSRLSSLVVVVVVVLVVVVVDVVVVGDVDVVGAEPAGKARVDLKVKRRPGPRSLRMRPARTAQAGTEQPTTSTSPTTTTTTTTTTRTTTTTTASPPALDAGDVVAKPRATNVDLAGVRRADEQVVFRLDLGFAVDGGARSGRRALAGEPLSTTDYRQVRAHGFGNLFVGTRGLLIPPLSSYVSLGFRLTPRAETMAPLADALDSTEDIQVRAGWAEAANFLPGRLLRAVRVRAGRQYVYGPWPIHFDGAVAAWTSKALQISALAGVRVDDFAPQGAPAHAPPVVALIAAVDLGAMGRAPITIRGTAMTMSSRRFADLELGYRPRRGLVVVAGARSIDDHIARERGQVRVQVSDETHVVFDLEHRHLADWRWDPSYIDPSDVGAARPYLELRPSEPQLRAALRAGTVFLGNIDLYVRAATAIDLARRPDEQTGYVEIGGAFEVRVRRQLAFSASGTLRDYELTNPPAVNGFQIDRGNEAQPLVDPQDPDQASALGQETFLEAGGGLKFSTGARRFSAAVEAYYRRTRYAAMYGEDTTTVGDVLDTHDSRAGARFNLDGWMSARLRLHLDYDLSSALDHAPEINGWKQLRVLLEGSF